MQWDNGETRDGRKSIMPHVAIPKKSMTVRKIYKTLYTGRAFLGGDMFKGEDFFKMLNDE